MSLSIVAKEGTHVMISNGGRYAVIEQRADQFFNCHGGSRSGTPAEDLDKVATLLDDADWTDKATAQARLDQIVTRGNELAQRML